MQAEANDEVNIYASGSFRSRKTLLRWMDSHLKRVKIAMQILPLFFRIKLTGVVPSAPARAQKADRITVEPSIRKIWTAENFTDTERYVEGLPVCYKLTVFA